MIKKHVILYLFYLAIFSGYGQKIPNKEAPKNFDDFREEIARGKLDTISYYSTTINSERESLIYLPPEFDKDQKYPVLYLLHGIGGDHFAWVKNGRVNHILDNLYDKNKLKPMIVVLPNGRAMKDDRATGNLFAKDKVAAFTTFEDDLLYDLIPFIESEYPVLKNKENRALAGLSMGGGQTLNFGLIHPEIFTWIGAFSAAPNTKEPSELLKDENELKKALNLLWISCGEADDLLQISKKTHMALAEKNIDHIYFVEPGNHTFEVWKNDIYHFSQLLFQ